MLKRLYIYPLIFAIFPVLSLVANNNREIASNAAIRPLIASFLLGGLVFVTNQLFLRNWHQAGLVTSIALLLFFTYGHVYALLQNFTIEGIAVFRHRTLLPLWMVLFLIGYYLVINRIKRSESLTFWLNLFSIFMLIYPVYTITSDLLQQGERDRTVKIEQGIMSEAISADNPDIYYIILDGYGREDVLNGIGYDNSQFVAELRARGFYVADCSQSNYAYTELSLTSSLNFNYLDAINALEHNARIRLLKHGVVRTFLQERGYQTVAFPTGYPWTEWTDADIYMGFNRPRSSLTEFEWLVLNTTLVRVWSDTVHINLENRFEIRRENTLSALANLKNLPARNGNFFVFAHIVVPHYPYIFGPNGEWSQFVDVKNYDGYRQGYLGQLTFINREMLQVIDILIAESKTAPVIIIQGDHGPQPDISTGASDKMPILNAYYLPRVNADELLYPSISPVNTFRVVLNSYFDQNLLLLEDRSYYSPPDDRDALTLVPNTCPKVP